jgi:hypothetical protein
MAPNHGKTKVKLKVVGLPKLLHLPRSDSTAAATVARGVREAVEELVPADQQGRSSSKSGSAAAVPYVGIILQAAGWLARAQVQEEHPQDVRHELNGAMVEAWHTSASILKQHDKLTLDHLRPALRPCPEDGVTPGRW